jgi:hypothetical protein
MRVEIKDNTGSGYFNTSAIAASYLTKLEYPNKGNYEVRIVMQNGSWVELYYTTRGEAEEVVGKLASGVEDREEKDDYIIGFKAGCEYVLSLLEEGN